MKKQTALVFCIEAGVLEIQVKLLLESLFIYYPESCPFDLLCFQPRERYKISSKSIKFLESKGVNFIDIGLNKEHSDYPLANKIYASAYVERNYNYRQIIFIDSDILFCDKPVFFESNISSIPHLRSVDYKGIGVCSFDDLEGKYWEDLFTTCSVEKHWFVQTIIDKKSVFGYYNSGVIMNPEGSSLFQRWLENFQQVSKLNHSPVAGNYFIEQSVLSATLMSLYEKVGELPLSYNLSLTSTALNYTDEVPVCLHYHRHLATKKVINELVSTIDNRNSSVLKKYICNSRNTLIRHLLANKMSIFFRKN